MACLGLGRYSLLESLLFTPGEGYWLLPHHLDRLLNSARAFALELSRARVEDELRRAAERLDHSAKVRLLVDAQSALRVEALPVTPAAPPGPVRLAPCPTPVDEQDPWLRHKTTRRDLYESARAATPHADDTVLVNRRGEVTEASSANIVVVHGDQHWTPPVSAGLLPGTFRRELLESGRIHERRLGIEDLRRADRIYLINSVRKSRTATFIG